MMRIRTYSWKQILRGALWVTLGTGTLVLLMAGLNREAVKTCQGVEVDMEGVNDHFFINKEDIIDIVKKESGPQLRGRPLTSFHTGRMEARLRRDIWIESAEVYFDRNGIMRISIREKDPIARVFCRDGRSFYVDRSDHILPLSNRHSARLPVFTGFPSSLSVLSPADSLLLRDVKAISLKIQQDAFLMAMIDQVQINQPDDFELIPKLGEQEIRLGDARNLDDKFAKMKLFYRKVVPVYGWGHYRKVDLSYREQLVATRSQAAEVQADSLRALELMKLMAEYSARAAADTGKMGLSDPESALPDLSLIQQSVVRDEPSTGDSVVHTTSAPSASAVRPATPPAPKPVAVKPAKKAVATSPTPSPKTIKDDSFKKLKTTQQQQKPTAKGPPKPSPTANDY